MSPRLVALVILGALGACAAEPPVAGPPDGSTHGADTGPDAADGGADAPDLGVDVGTDAGSDVGPIDATLIHEPSGLPCDVAGVLGRNCTVCHTSPPQGGAPVPLLTRDDLVAPLPSDPTSTIAQLALDWMRSGVMPPAPTMPIGSADIATFDAWVSAGMPAGTCTMATSPFDGPTTCTSAMHWVDGDTASPLMRPGGACITCHASLPTPPVPLETMAGTVFATVHEPDDCDGASDASDPITITVRDLSGAMISATANAAGNFSSTTPIMLPILSATVTYQGRTRVMASPQASADCNSCHTEGGTSGAPGRILLP